MVTITELIKQKYGAIAAEVAGASSDGSATSRCCKGETTLDPITRDLYSTEDSASLPKNAVQASLGCGNPNAMVDMAIGQTVLDLGSGNHSFSVASERRRRD